MAIRLEKGQKINLEKNNGTKLSSFCVGCNWGAISREEADPSLIGKLFSKTKKVTHNIDLDLSCIMVDAEGEAVDHIYSPLYRKEFLDQFNMPLGKLNSLDGALHHSGDDTEGDADGDDGLDNEIITVDLNRVSENVHQIFFFLNNCGPEDFSMIPYASIRMYEGTPERVVEVFAQYDVAAQAQFKGSTALIMGKLYRRNGAWKFAAIGDAYPDPNLVATIARILQNYAR